MANYGGILELEWFYISEIERTKIYCSLMHGTEYEI